MSTLKEMLIAADGSPRKVRFLYFRAGMLWYTTETGFAFPVPVSDAGEATFLAEDKASFFMRYIRKHLDTIAKAGQAA